MQHQFAANEVRIDALAAKPTAARKKQPPTYESKLTDDRELRFFSIELYNTDYHPAFLLSTGMKMATFNHHREHHPQTLDEAMEIALRFDHAGQLAAAPKSDWETKATYHRCRKADNIAPNCLTLEP
ncbi:hypothetical protein PHPALM_194 [Phytophthora palmivora]|uniref:Uncharacterized protein n=1 Tax=Phytophthora palmivora TaxID=4796 RepID=A0A2P4YVG9_9STRA|nr:hypothetical protein PHPALM_194 [Phytophthora palmivora]